MIRSYSVLVTCASLALSVLGGTVWADQFERAGSKTEAPPAEGSGSEPAPTDPASSRMTMRVAVRKIEYVDRVVNGVTTKIPVVRIAYEDQSVALPKNDAEIQTLRDELKKLRERKVESLDLPGLVRELHQEREEARADEAWKKLQRIRKELAELEREHPGTPAAGVARTVQGNIPSEAPPMFGSVGPIYASDNMLAPIPTTNAWSGSMNAIYGTFPTPISSSTAAGPSQISGPTDSSAPMQAPTTIGKPRAEPKY